MITNFLNFDTDELHLYSVNVFLAILYTPFLVVAFLILQESVSLTFVDLIPMVVITELLFYLDDREPSDQISVFVHTLLLKLEALVEAVICYVYVKAVIVFIPLSVLLNLFKLVLIISLGAGVFLLWIWLNSRRYEDKQ